MGTAAGANEYRAILERVQEWSAETRSLFFTLADGATLSFDPGQFVSLALPIGDTPPLTRAYSIASLPVRDAPLELCVDHVPGGAGSQYLFGLRPGDGVTFTGPFGSFKLAEPPPTPLVFIGQGTGIAPIRPMVQRALAGTGAHPITVLQGGAAAEPLVYGDELAALAEREPRCTWEAVPTPAGVSPLENPALEALVRERYVDADTDRTRHFWICAVDGLATRLRDLLRTAGYERRAVRCEKW